MDYRQMTAPCGIDCFNCALYAARENDKLRSIVAKNMNISFEDAVCSGCRNQDGLCIAHSLEEKCSVYKCIEKKGLEFCFECADFPCDFLHPYADQASMRPHNTKVFNLGLMKKMGVESWAETKAKKVRDTYFKEKFKL
jgi:hypothetical protein